jgi:hypothetical protein
LLVHERFAPYGFLPSSLRGQPAVVLQRAEPVTTVKAPPLEKEMTSAGGSERGVSHEGTIVLKKDGSAQLQLTQLYHERWAFQLRKRLNGISEKRRKEEIEARILGLALPGARIEKLGLPNLDKLDEPVRLTMTIDAPTLARVANGELVFDIPFMGSLGPLVRLPQRQTPLYISERYATRTKIVFTVKLPEGAKIVSPMEDTTIKAEGLSARVRYEKKGTTVVVHREVTLSAGRIKPDAYPAFREKMLEADDALTASVRVRLK